MIESINVTANDDKYEGIPHKDEYFGPAAKKNRKMYQTIWRITYSLLKNMEIHMMIRRKLFLKENNNHQRS